MVRKVYAGEKKVIGSISDLESVGWVWFIAQWVSSRKNIIIKVKIVIIIIVGSSNLDVGITVMQYKMLEI